MVSNAGLLDRLSRFVLVATLLSAAFGAAHADDRSIAEWVIREGGSVVLAGHSEQVRELRELPSSEFQLKTINLVDTNYLAQDVQRIGTLPHIKHLYMSGRTRRPFSLKVKTTKIYEDGEDRDLTDGWVFLRKLPHLEYIAHQRDGFQLSHPDH